MKKNYFYNLLLTVFNLLVPVISFPYVARVLGPEGVGKVQFTLTLSQYIALIAALGIPIYGVREIAKVKDDPRLLSQTFSELIIINFITSILYFLFYLFAVLFIPFFQKDILLFTWSSTIVLLSFTSIDWFYSGLEAFKMIALRSIIVKTISLLLILLCVRHPADTLPYLLISMLSILGNNFINLWVARKKVNLGFKKLQLKRHVAPLIYIFGTTLASTLYTTFDSIILGFLSGNKAVGLYTAATKISKISLPVIMAYGAVLIPTITKAYHDKDKEKLTNNLDRSYAYIALLSIPICAGLFVFAPQLIFFFSGAGFSDAIVTMRIMSPLPALVGLGYFWGYQVTLPLGKDKFLMMSAIAGMVVSLTLNFILVPQLKENGAAIANVASEVVVTLSYFLLIKKHHIVSLKHSYIIEALISCLPFGIFLFVSNNYLFNNEFITLLADGIICMFTYCFIQIALFKNTQMLELVQKYTGKKPFIKKTT